ncbi:MAG: cyclic pyranopterin monophosphate synthase MoaC [Clostridia bacterium]|nr:cyclic pyranopterin monophosphate synthase MoaC [Clostridia bacterium]
MEQKLTHIDEAGNVVMVDVGDKAETKRRAVVRCRVVLNAHTFGLLTQNALPKGDVLTTAKVAGIMAAKKTWELIPMCHPLPLDAVRVELFPLAPDKIRIEAEVSCNYHTGVEMEALTACSVAALTVYDMCKAVDRGMEIHHVLLLHKSGGKSGTYQRQSEG